MSRTHDEHGAVTAETAMALPLLAVFAVSLAWLVALGVTQVRAHDAAREVARAAARSDTSGEAVGLGRRVAPSGSQVSVRQGDGVVVATVRSPVPAPTALLRRWSSLRVHAEAVAVQEPTS